MKKLPKFSEVKSSRNKVKFKLGDYYYSIEEDSCNNRKYYDRTNRLYGTIQIIHRYDFWRLYRHHETCGIDRCELERLKCSRPWKDWSIGTAVRGMKSCIDRVREEIITYMARESQRRFQRLMVRAKRPFFQ